MRYSVDTYDKRTPGEWTFYVRPIDRDTGHRLSIKTNTDGMVEVPLTESQVLTAVTALERACSPGTIIAYGDSVTVIGASTASLSVPDDDAAGGE